MARVSVLSNENIWFPVRNENPLTGSVDPTLFDVAMAFTNGVNPIVGDWTPAVWETGTVTIDGRAYYLARLLVGPDAHTLTANTYKVFLKITLPDGDAVIPGDILTIA